MNAEFLLDAIGQLDDALIREAERYRPKARYGRMLSLAASFAVVILLAYGVAHIRMGGMSGGAAPALSFPGGGNGGAPASGNSAPREGDYSGADAPNAMDSAGGSVEAEAPETTEPSPGEGLSDSKQGALSGTIFVGGGSYILTGEVLAELPEGGEPVLLGELLTMEPDSPRLCTDAEELVGLNLWAENDGTDLLTAVYVELPKGGFVRAELAEP